MSAIGTKQTLAIALQMSAFGGKADMKCTTLFEWPAPKSPRCRSNAKKTSLGWAYRIYIDGAYMGTGLTQASARDGAKRMLAIYEKARRRK